VRLLTLLALSIVLTADSSFAQLDTATVIGTVTDSQNTIVPGASVTSRNVSTGIIRASITDSAGRYRIAAIPPGEYEFTVQLPGFAATTRTGVTLTLGSESVINFELRPAGVIERVTVAADVPVVETTTAAVQNVLNRDQLDLLPLIGRDFESLLRLTPGAQENNASTGFGGSRGRSNHWHIDGVDNAGDITGYSRQTPALDSIQEVQVLVTGFKAEFGQASGGVINAITRSGTNAVRGSGFFLFRNQDMMSQSPYADRSLPKEPFQRVQYGGSIGGPLKRDTLHYFAAYEREDRDTTTSSERTLPASTANFAPATRQFLTQNDIPLALFGDGGRQRHVRPEFVDVHKLSVKLDQQLSAAQSLTFRHTFESSNEPSGFSGTLFDFNGSTPYSRHNYAALNHKWVGINKLSEAYLQIGQTYFDGRVNFPSLQNVTVSGAFLLGGTSDYPQRRTDYTYQLVENLTWIRRGRTGEHTMKAGAQVKFFRSDGFFDSNFRGTWTFPNLQAFINGVPSRFTQRQGDTNLRRPNDIYGMYIQDDWRPTPALTLNLGLRYDYENGKTEALRDVTGEPGPGISRDKNNVSPRFGFSWAPGNNTRHALYGGIGLYYDQIILNIQGNARFTPPKVVGIQIDNPAWPDPFRGGTVQIPPPSISIIDPELVTPYNRNVQIGYRRELLPDLGVDISFLYNRGYDQVGTVPINAGRPGSATITGGGAVRPDPNFTNKTLYTNFGEIKYTGLLVDLKKRFSRRFQGNINYTLSKGEDNAFNFLSDIFYPEQPDLNWGPSVGDRRHRIEGHAEATLPFDLQAGIIVEYRSELPLDIIASGRDLNGDGITGEWVHESICRTINCDGFRYSRNSVRELPTGEANRLRALFGLAPIDRFENNPKYFNIDMTLQKRVRLGGQQAARVTIEAFNLLNIPQRRFPDNSASLSGTQQLNILSPLFGQYLRVEQPRAVQVTLQYDF
jgi:type 1 fimbria pilin